MNKNVDIVFLGQFQADILLSCFREGTPRDPFWATVKHLAFGTFKFLDMLRDCEIKPNEGPDFSPASEELELFEALESFTLVLDVRKVGRKEKRVPSVDGLVSFGKPAKVYRRGGMRMKYQERWTSFLRTEWEYGASRWHVPDTLHIKSLKRGEKFHFPKWQTIEASRLPEWAMLARRLQNRALADMDSWDSDLPENVESPDEWIV